MRVGCVLLAAGRSARMGGGDKLLARLGDRPLLAHSLAACEGAGSVTDVVAVTSAANRRDVAEIVLRHSAGKVRALVTGGAQRQDSVAAGLAALPRADLVAVHDGARPLAGAVAFEEGIARAVEMGAAVAGGPAVDTMKVVDADGIVQSTPERATLRRAATPQVFRRELLEWAHASARADGFSGTDDASLVERLGEPVAIYETAGANPKITTPEDAVMAEALLAGGAPEARTGIGIDVHRFADAAAGRRLVLGGVEIPYERGLAGHSDADALVHALIDALLGAAGMGDIGARFGTEDPVWRDGDSIAMLRIVTDDLRAAGWRPASADATVIAEAPRLRPFVERMRMRLADAMGLDAPRVNVKATTAEGMGAIGSGDGIAAQAVATIVRG